MSAKNVDKHNRLRSVTVGFRMSPQESRQLNTAVALSGLKKQDYIIGKLLDKDVIVQGNPRVFKALKNQLASVLEELQRIQAGSNVSDELLEEIRLITVTLGGLRGDCE